MRMVLPLVLLIVGILIGYGVAYIQSSTIVEKHTVITTIFRTATITLAMKITNTVTKTTTETVGASAVQSTVLKTVTMFRTVTKTIVKSFTPAQRIEVEFLPKKAYYYRLMQMIEKANKSIYVLMFVAKYDPYDRFDWANDILRALCKARSRGIVIKVVFDKTTYYEYRQTIEFLKSCGIDIRVWFGTSKLHAKLVIIDGKYLFIGSHNWTESALYYNIEASALITDYSIVEKALRLFNNVWIYAKKVD